MLQLPTHAGGPGPAHRAFEHPAGGIFTQHEPGDYLNPDAGESAVLSFTVELLDGWKIVVGLLKVKAEDKP